MASFNRVILMGNLTRDPEIRYTSGGTAVCDIGLAVNDGGKVPTAWVEETTFVDVTLWGRTAEVAGEYLGKGSPVLIEAGLSSTPGRPMTAEAVETHVVCERMQMVGPRGAGAPGGKAVQPRQQNDLYSQPEPADDYGLPHGRRSPRDDIPF